MATGRIRRTARRGLAVLLLGWLVAAVGAVLTAPSAGAAPSATVEIRDVTSPVVSVDAGGTVTFVNRIADQRVQVGVGPLSVPDVTVRTEVSLRLPSGTRVLAPGESVTERFDASCLTCAITYTYRAQSGPGLTDALLGQAVASLPALPVGVPFVVNTILPALPDLPSVDLPSPPAVTRPLPVPAPPVGDGEDPEPTPTGPQPTQRPAPSSTGGTPYSYDTGSGGIRMTPVDGAAAAAFDPSRFAATSGAAGPEGGARPSAVASGGSGGLVGTYDGASVPVFGRLGGLDGADIAVESAAGEEVAGGRALPLAALVAVVALASTTAALVRTHQARR